MADWSVGGSGYAGSSVVGTAGSVAATVGESILIAFVLLGTVPLLSMTYQFLLVGLHPWRDHYNRCEPFQPRVAVLVPAWNEAAVIGHTIDRLMGLHYPPDALRVYVIDDASTDGTPEAVLAKADKYPGRVFHLRREHGGEGKAHTLNHGLRTLLSDSWMQAMLITDADVVYAADSLRRMTRHLADPKVGAVTAYITEGSRPGNYMTRFVGYEYITAQAGARRAQNVLGALACLAGGAQLHSRANLEAIGGRIDTTSLAEDTFTTINTQLAGRRALIEPNAIVYAEEPDSVNGLWKQRLRWGRGNVQVTSRYRWMWFRRGRLTGPARHLGGIGFGCIWFTTMLLPVVLVLSSSALVALYFTDTGMAWRIFQSLWIINALGFFFTTTFALLIDPSTARRVWREAFLFPGAMSLALIVYSAFRPVFEGIVPGADSHGTTKSLVGTIALLFIYVWPVAALIGAWGAKRLEETKFGRLLVIPLVYLVGFGSILCAVTVHSYIREWQGAEMVWDKTEKKGTVAA